MDRPRCLRASVVRVSRVARLKQTIVVRPGSSPIVLTRPRASWRLALAVVIMTPIIALIVADAGV